VTGGGGGTDRDGTRALDEFPPDGAVASAGVVVPAGVVEPEDNASFGAVYVVGV
jgi:hypothetical protein